MLLSGADIKLLEKAGHDPKEFAHLNRQGLLQLRNSRGYCVFYNVQKRSCMIYRLRPVGCRIYPVIYSEKEGVVVDDICPMMSTVSAAEVNGKTRRLMKLLESIDKQAGRFPPSL
jgi:Fe-S-cluster containining protein